MLPHFALLLLTVLDLTPAASDPPFRQPQLAVSGDLAALAFGSGHHVYLSLSRDGGATFPAPVRVAELPALALGNHRGPRVVFAGKSILVTAGVTPAGQPHGPADLLAFRSTDEGRTWSPGTRINGAQGSAGEAFHALAGDGRNTVWAVWLAHRDNRVSIAGSVSPDGGVTWSQERSIYESPDGNVCECCHPSAIVDAGGTLRVMWRNSLAGNRDFYLATSKDGQQFRVEKLGAESWQLKACPMDGGGIAMQGAKPVTFWRRKSDLFLASPGEAEQRIAAGRNPKIAAFQGGVALTWQNENGIWVRTPGAEPRAVSPSGTYPAIAAGKRLVLAWEEGRGIRTRILD
ncbi:MAG: glycoside hydrolase [Bryobacteraceae bacterium]|nr:glycoside hydrolase [Bryobacteraceae bacterium]